MLLLEPSMHGSMWTQPCRKDAIDIKSLQVARTAWPDALSEHIKKIGKQMTLWGVESKRGQLPASIIVSR